MRTIVAVPDPALNHELTTALGEFPEIEIVRQITVYPEPDDFLRIVRSRKPDFAFLSTEDFPKFQALAAVIDDRMPGLPVISVARGINSIELIPKLMHLGIREVLASPITHQKLGETIAAIAQQLAKHPTPVVRLGDIYAFFPAKPGVGSSTISVSTSCALADELHVRTLLLDCDLMAGVTKFLLKLGNSSSIVNALEHADTLDEDLWSQMVGHWDGLEVLHAGELAPPASLTSASLEVVLGFARGLYDTICADLASSLDPFTVQIMHEARRIFMVTTPELVPLYLAADRLKHLKDLGLADKVSLLLNRKNASHRGLSDNEASQLVGLPIAHGFSNDYPGVQGAILDGVPISQRSSLGQSIMALARSLARAVSMHDAPPAHHRKFLEFFHVPSARDHETVWRD
jgi:MinD-like ATPase involved in chromosome partitioning or flagellar assembly